MSLTLLDGTDATVDLSVTFPSGTSGSSMRCIINAMEYSRSRDFQDATTLCSGKWRSERPGRNQDRISVSKFSSVGATISDLSPILTATAAVSITFTAKTGNTFVGTYWLESDSVGVIAGQFAMPGNCVFRSSDSVATTWVIT